MNANVENVLNQAFNLIESGQLEDARLLLKPVLETTKDNPDLWWLYAHSVTDKETARLALNNVLRIDSTYPDARTLLEKIDDSADLEQAYTDDEFDKEPPFIPALPASLPGLSPGIAGRSSDAGADKAFVGDLDDDELEQEQVAFYLRPLFYVPILALLLLGAVAIVVLKPFAANAPATQVALSTDISVPTVELASTALEQSANTETRPAVTGVAPANLTDLSETQITQLSTELKQFNVADADFSIMNTTLGQSLVLTVCTTSGPEMRTLLLQVMTSLAKLSASYETSVEAIGVRMMECETSTVLRWIGSAIADTVSYSAGTLNDSEYQARWTPIIES